MELTEKQIKQMIEAALKTRKNAFTHRSGHNIGASVLTLNGDIYGGCNIESVISGLGTCAERAAIDHAITHGHYDIQAVCTVDKGLTPTCGACLQYIMLFSQLADKEIVLINSDINGDYEITTLKDVLPQGYKTKNNLEVIRAYSKKGEKIIKGKTKHVDIEKQAE